MSDTQTTVTSPQGFDISSNFETPDEMQQAIAVEEVAEPPVAADDEPPPPIAAEPAATEPITEKPDRRTREGKKKSIQSEIDELTARRGQSQAEYDATQTRLAEARAELKDLEDKRAVPQPVAPVVEGDPEPQFADFLEQVDPQSAYFRAVARWEGRQESRKLHEATERQRQQERVIQARQATTRADQQRTMETIRKNQNITDEQEFLAKISPDVLALEPIGQLPPGQNPTGKTAVADSILASSVPDRLMLHFTEQPAELTRIAALPVHLAIREMGILEGSLRSGAANHGPAPTPRYSTAPAPTKPLGGSPVVSASADEPVDGSSPSAFDRFATAARARRLKEQSRR